MRCDQKLGFTGVSAPEAMLIINKDVVLLQVGDGLRDYDVFINLATYGCQRDWSIVFWAGTFALLEDR